MRVFKPSIFDVYLLKELVPPFIFSVAIFSSLGVAIATLSDLSYKIINSNLPFIYALEIFFLRIPEYVSYALPISVLLTTLITYSRLNKDSELIAFRSCGLNVARIITPAVLLSILITVITFIFNEQIVPQANYQATKILVEQLNEERQFMLKKDIFYPEYLQTKESNGEQIKELKRLFYAQKFDGKNMQSLTILDIGKSGLNKVIISEKGAWNNQDKTWDLFNGFIYDVTSNPLSAEGSAFKQTQIYFPKTPLELAVNSRDPFEMNIAQSYEYIKLLRLLGDEKTILMFQVRTAQKIAFPFVCIIFGLIGSSIGCQPNTTNKMTSFSLCVAIVFGYYLSSFIIGGFGLIGAISPWMSAWIPNLAGLAIGYYLVTKSE